MTAAELSQIAISRYSEIDNLNKLDNFYDYEKQFVLIWQDIGRQILEKNLGTLSNDKRKKKPYNAGLCNNE